MDDEVQGKVLHLLDILSVEVAAGRSETAELRNEMSLGFRRVEVRLGNLETRVEGIESKVAILDTKVDRLESRFNVLDVKFNVLDAKVNALDVKFNVLDAKVEEIGVNLSSFRDEFERRILPLEA